MEYAWIKGFNYQPSYSSCLQYTWTHFDRAAWEREVPYATRFGSTVLRIWLDWSAYLARGEAMVDNVASALDILGRSGLQMMPVLFNRWVDRRYPAGGISNEDLTHSDYAFDKFWPYVDALVGRLGQDQRIVMWDLCNEPQTPREQPEISLREAVWLTAMADRVRHHRPRAPITIGAMTYDHVVTLASLVDVISFHPYAGSGAEMDKMCRDHLDIARNYDKPLLCTETCKGSLDDQERGALARACIETLEQHGVGWLAWQMVSGRFVTGSRERTDSNAVRPNEGYMPFVLPDGSTRPGHEWLERRQAR
jgi:endo-1,4-beta-mannosidase